MTLLALVGAEMVKAVAPWISVWLAGVLDAIGDHLFGDVAVIGSQFLFLFA
jgi:hypothetical protein